MFKLLMKNKAEDGVLIMADGKTRTVKLIWESAGSAGMLLTVDTEAETMKRRTITRGPLVEVDIRRLVQRIKEYLATADAAGDEATIAALAEKAGLNAVTISGWMNVAKTKRKTRIGSLGLKKLEKVIGPTEGEWKDAKQ